MLKISMIYKEVKIKWKFLWIHKGTQNKGNKLSKQENDTINKQAPGIVWRSKKLLQLAKKFEYKHTLDKNKLTNRKVRYHCHCTGKYWEAAHSNYRLSNEIPVIFQKASNYEYCILS